MDTLQLQSGIVALTFSLPAMARSRTDPRTRNQAGRKTR